MKECNFVTCNFFHLFRFDISKTNKIKISVYLIIWPNIGDIQYQEMRELH